MKATFFTASALLATAFAAPAAPVARAEYDIRVSISDDFSGAFAYANIPSDGYKFFIKDFNNAAGISKNGFPAGSSAQLNTIVKGVECQISNTNGQTFGKLTERKTFIDFDLSTPKPVNLTGFFVSCIIVKSS